MIGGQAPLPPNYQDLFGPDFAIEDWRGDLLGQRWSYPAASVVSFLTLFSHDPRSSWNRDDKKTKKAILKEMAEIREAMIASSHFPDNAHPGWPAYEQLLAQIIPWIRSS